MHIATQSQLVSFTRTICNKICESRSIRSLVSTEHCPLAHNKGQDKYHRDVDHTKEFESLPASGGQVISTIKLILNGGPSNLHKYCDKLHTALGPVYRCHLGPLQLVFLADPQLIQYVIKNEGQYPHHNVPEAWQYYNQIHQTERGLFFQTGPKWRELRTTFNKVLLHDEADLKQYSRTICEINESLFDHWLSKRASGASNTVSISDIKPELSKWSLEATGSILFGHKLGCVANGADPRANDLVDSVTEMFKETANFQLIPARIAHKLKMRRWHRFEAASASMLATANMFAREYMELAKCNTRLPSIVSKLLELGTLDSEDTRRSLVDLIIASADTTSNSLQWSIYLLSMRQDIQQKIREETRAYANQPEALRSNCPYLRSFLRESLRLYPTAPFLARTLDKDICLADYKIPKHTPIVFSLYTTGRSDKYFDKPNECFPERWLRQESAKVRATATATLPFGLGARNCVGRKAAELEVTLFLASFVQRFQCEPLQNGEVDTRLNMILCPSKPIGVSLKPIAN